MDKKNVIYIVIALVIVLLGFYFFMPAKVVQQNQQQTTNQTPVVNNQNQTPAPAIQTISAKTYNVSIVNFAFSPSTLNINKGDTIVWTNNDSAPHQVKGDALGSLSSPVMTLKQTYSFIFNDASTFNYHCAIHPSMTGVVVVK